MIELGSRLSHETENVFFLQKLCEIGLSLFENFNNVAEYCGLYLTKSRTFGIFLQGNGKSDIDKCSASPTPEIHICRHSIVGLVN